MVAVRPYRPEDYAQIKALYQQGDLYGGQFDDDRDSPERLATLIAQVPDAVLVAEDEGRICGTVSLIRDVRTAWLFRFAVEGNEAQIVKMLYDHAAEILKSEGHKQVLVYSPVDNEALDERYASLGFNKGSNYTCYYKSLI